MPLPSKMPAKSANSHIGEYSLVSNFPGFNARKDATILPPNTLVSPSQNVVIGTSGRISQVKGYFLDGAGSTTIDSGILSNYDFDNFKGDRRNMRAGFMTVAGNDGKLQYRYVDSTGAVSWVNLMTGLTSIHLCFCDFWDNTALLKYVLWVDGSANAYSWNGAVTTFASGTANTITKQGTNTWAQEGFTATGSFTIGGVTYTYTGGSTTTTLTGVSADTSALTVGAEIHQTPVTTALSGMTPPTGFSGFTSVFFPTVIGCGQLNQIYLGFNKSNNLCISKQNSFTDYSFSSPRVALEGCLIPLDAPPLKFVAQEGKTTNLTSDMYISEGLNTWAIIESELSSDLTKETLKHIRMKTAPLMGALSERLCTKMKNEIMFVSNDKVANFFGYQSYQYVPAIIDFSFPIIDDMNSYDFTDASIFYHKNYVYIAIPKHSLIRIYNMTDQTKQYTSFFRDVEDVTQQPWFWEAPVAYPISGFYVVDGELYGHNYTTSESYKLFSSGSFNGQDITANATFAFDDKGDRTQSKGSNEIFSEGYIKQNTLLNVSVSGDLSSCQTTQTMVIDGNDSQIVCFSGGGTAQGHSLGQDNLGSKPLGGALTAVSSLPAWFHSIKTYVSVPFYLQQISFSSKGSDLQWELITFGTNALPTNESNNAITQ